QGRIPTQESMHRVAGDGETGSRNIFFTQVRQRFLEFPTPLVVAARHSLARLTCLPNAQHPNPVKPHLAQAVQFSLPNVIEGGSPTQGPRQLGQPDTSVDLIKRRIKWSVHINACGLEQQLPSHHSAPAPLL